MGRAFHGSTGAAGAPARVGGGDTGATGEAGVPPNPPGHDDDAAGCDAGVGARGAMGGGAIGVALRAGAGVGVAGGATDGAGATGVALTGVGETGVVPNGAEAGGGPAGDTAGREATGLCACADEGAAGAPHAGARDGVGEPPPTAVALE